MSDRPPFPIGIDNTLRKSFVACPQKFYREYLQHWKPCVESVHLVAGGAFAKGLEVARKCYFDEGMDQTSSLAEGCFACIKHYGDFECPDDSQKSLPNMLAGLAEYFTHYGWGTDLIQPYRHSNGKHAIEFSFALPIEDTKHPETGEPILYVGRSDMIGVYNGQIFVIDEKTTKQLGTSWSRQWNMASQFTGYCWAAQQFDYPVAGAIIRGMSILKREYGHAESLQYRPQHMIDQWYEQLIRDVNRMIQAWENSQWDFNLGDSCGSYGGCPFQDVCSSKQPERMLEASFVQRKWDPMEKD